MWRIWGKEKHFFQQDGTMWLLLAHLQYYKHFYSDKKIHDSKDDDNFFKSRIVYTSNICVVPSVPKTVIQFDEHILSTGWLKTTT